MMRIAEIVHPAYPEEPSVFAERLALYPEGVLVVAGAEVGGYVLSHPWLLDRPPDLNTLLGALPEAPDTYYIHDIAMLPELRGRGLARTAIEMLVARAAGEGFSTVSLVSVIAQSWWSAFGFHDASDRIAREKLLSYGGNARYMIRAIGGGDRR